MTQPWFDEVGLAYANNYAQMAEAWTVFRGQRDAILREVTKTVQAKLAGASAPNAEFSGSALATYWEGSAWVKARREANKPNSRAAFAVGLGTFNNLPTGKTFSFVAYGQYAMSSTRFKRVPAELRGERPLEATCTGSWAYFPYVAIAIANGTEFALDNFVRSTEAAVERFVEVDARLGAWYASTKSAGEAD